MSYKAAAREIHQGQVKPVYVCYGTEKYLMDEFVTYTIHQLIEPDYMDFALSKFDMAETRLEEVIDDAETPPFLAPRKVVIAKDATFLTAAKDNGKLEHRIERLLEYMDKPVEGAVIVFTVAAEKLDERKKIVKQLKERAALIPFQALSAEELAQWVERKAEQLHSVITRVTAEQLIRNAGTSLQTLSAELEKMSLYVGKEGTITGDIVENMVVRSTEQNVFLMIEELAQLRTEKAMRIFYDLLKMREEPIKLIALIARQFRIMLQVKEMTQQGYSQQQTAQQLSLHPYGVKVAAEQGRKFEMKRLASILSELAELDYRMKSGKIDKVLGLELFLLRMAG
ncbi:DNA polymerase III subunit delta [Paenibacillus swuensis]|uniref:DNA polymerase III subunit delta n=1 Tax=Paenibacillus swuensis TaxID=1178515 RepID=A0A172TJP1_9BACL|nr:DNA polymerase III subunit delta [Paenibacillus swuensis]ANE47279.1 DNA polymerase III subunit delta [Paenibacillus swuensis]